MALRLKYSYIKIESGEKEYTHTHTHTQMEDYMKGQQGHNVPESQTNVLINENWHQSSIDLH